MQPIVISFEPCGLGRVEFVAHISTADRKSFHNINFKLDYRHSVTWRHECTS
ncbi:MAG: hypothetical protein LBI54_08285 [Lachnospiraceae bacterium]|jgi:hypothetical protein|nr:hypothetical protein [Lachnospiraceae bacterium]